MLLTEVHQINKNSVFYKEILEITHKSKNIYNHTLYCIKDYFKINNTFIKFSDLYHIVKTSDCYIDLPRKVSQLTIKKCYDNYQCYFKALQSYKKNPTKFKGVPKPPKYLDKNGYFLVVYNIQAINKGNILSGTSIKVETRQNNIKEIHLTKNKILVIYEREKVDLQLNKSNIIGIDRGIRNLVVLSSNKIGYQPKSVNGSTLISLNQYYNKIKSKFQSLLPKNQYWSNKLEQLTVKRNNRIMYLFHKLSNYVINECVRHNIGTIVLGKNDFWKQDVNLGRKTNQKFTCIPFEKLTKYLKYKCELMGIDFIETEESYTSKCSFIDLEPLQHSDKYLGSRFKRGLFRSKNGVVINSDLNGSLNIIRKVFPKAFNANEILGLVVNPLQLCLHNL